MDVALFLQRFESRLSSYTGDDPLEQWDRFVEHLEQRLPADRRSEMSLVFEAVVQRFINVERYANDIRYVNYCIKYAGYHAEPVSLYSYVFRQGIGTRTAALYVAWAQHFEQKGMNEQADAVYQKALENQAQPADTVLHEYRQFQARTTGHSSLQGSRNPLQNLNLTNQPVARNKVSVDCPSETPANRMIMIVSRSETVCSSQASSSAQLVSEYMKDELLCDGSELCFEEVRAAKYFQKLKEQQEKAERALFTPRKQQQHLQQVLERLVSAKLAVPDSSNQPSSQQPVSTVDSTSSLNPSQQSSQPSSRRSVGLRLLSEPAFIQEAAAAAAASPEPPSPTPPSPELSRHASTLADHGMDGEPEQLQIFHPDCGAAFHQDAGSFQPQGQNVSHQSVVPPQEVEEKLDASHTGTANLSHLTPNTSLGFVQATPSRALPSPTVNTREALGVIMDMFQAPTFLDEPFSHSSMLHTGKTEVFDVPNGSVAAEAMRPARAAFTIFQDEDKENGSTAAAPSAAEKSKPARALCDITASKLDKPNDTPPDLMPDESTMWGARYNSLHSLAACPNSTTDFAMLAHCVSTPFTNKTSLGGIVYRDQEISGDDNDADEDAFVRRQPKKLSPIIEQSPSDEKLSETSSRLLPSSSSAAQHGTIVGEALASLPPCLASSSSYITMVQPPPPAVLSFRDHTLCPAEGWEVYASPKPLPTPVFPTSSRSRNELLEILEEPDQPASPARDRDVPMSPECPLNPNWMSVKSPQRPAGSDLDAFASPCRPGRSHAAAVDHTDVPMSPEQPRLCADVPMSPQPVCGTDVPMMSPDTDPRSNGRSAPRLVSDPWDSQLISHQLSTLNPPLTAHPHCFTWQCDVPNITPKTTISMGKTSLRVDSVVGQGAFSTVYQVTDPMTYEKMVFKVQKPANPWEFYINTQLDARLQPDVRLLFNRLHSAHLFHNGSVMLGELHKHGTLLNAVNIYKTQSDKVMPQPLVMYFAACILHMVEQLHSIKIIHADIKPDNFVLGDRFLEDRQLGPDSCSHGLVLIDLGQSIDMELYPPGTAFTNKCLTSGFQCTEMLSGKPWNYQTDYFGVAGTVHCMLFGSYMQVKNEGSVWKTDGVFRRKPHSELWQEFFHTLLNVPHCGALPSLRSLRRQLTEVLQLEYSSKLPTLKSRLVVQLLESQRAARR